MAHSSNKLVDAVIRAAEIVGYDGEGHDGLTGYLTRVAEVDPRTFVPLIGKAIPLMQTSAVASGHADHDRRSPQEIRAEFESMGFTVTDVPPPTAIMKYAPVINGKYQVLDPDPDDDDDSEFPDFVPGR